MKLDPANLRKPLGRVPYFTAGSALFVLKFLLDSLLALFYGQPYSPMIYVRPSGSPLLHPPKDPGYWLAMWAMALPFIAVGLILTLRRLQDARMPPALSLLFFLPFLNLLFFLACALLPSREPVSGTQEGSAAIVERPPPKLGRTPAVWIAAGSGAVLGLASAALSIDVLEVYGAGLFLGAPVICGFVTSTVFCALHAPSKKGVALSTLLSLGLCAFVAVTFALEGFVCIVMAAPLVTVGALLGSFLGFRCFAARRGTPGAVTGTALLLLPVTILVEGLAPLAAAPPRPVESRVMVAASPEIVWRNVIRFPPLAPSQGWIFRMGVAEPVAAEISGEGPGALRRCRFTTGDFLEPIEIWNPGRELSFSVASSPDPMRELTLWNGIRPPHLDGYLESTRGQFLLRSMPGGRTLLIGRTWYRTNMAPEAYWRLWADPIIHAIHLRVLEHVARLAEREEGGTITGPAGGGLPRSRREAAKIDSDESRPFRSDR